MISDINKKITSREQYGCLSILSHYSRAKHRNYYLRSPSAPVVLHWLLGRQVWVQEYLESGLPLKYRAISRILDNWCIMCGIIYQTCVQSGHYEPDWKMERLSSRRLRFCPMSEPEGIENASVTKQGTSGKALIQVFSY